jgi:PAS domain S-box-containing protein
MDRRSHPPLRFAREWPLRWQYALALGVVAAALASRWLLDGQLGTRARFLPLLAALLPLAVVVRLLPFFIASLAGIIGTWILFIPPQISLWPLFLDPADGLILGYACSALAATWLAGWWWERARARQEKHEGALRRDRDLRLVSDAAPAMIAYVDARLRYRFTNNSYESWFGRRSEDFPGRHVREVIGEEAYERVRPYIERALGGEHVEFETAAPRGGGEARILRTHYVPDMREDGSVAGLYALIVDVSERVQARRAIAASEARYRTLFESIDEGFYTLRMNFDEAGRPVGFRIIEANPAFARQAGLQVTPGDSIHTHIPDLEEHWLEIYGKVALTGESTRFVGESRALGRWFDVCAFPIGDPADRQVAVLFTDITERRNAEIELASALAAQREGDRRKDVFLATLAHELRNPLAGIRMASSVLQGTAGVPRQVEEMTAVIDRQSSRLMRLIDDLMDVSRISQGKMVLRKARVDLGEVVRQIASDSLSVCEGRGRKTITVVPEHPVPVEIDTVRIGQVIANLIQNACRFTPPGGELRLTLACEGHEAVVRVSDTGAGIPEAELARIFELFEQGDSPAQAGEGLGIGLALARSIVELHEGTIEARSDGPGKGSEFTVRLALCEPEASRADHDTEAVRPAAAANPGSSRRIVVADDNRDALDAVALLLRLRGHEVITAHDGVDALQKIALARPDVALLDIGMPVIDGYEVARQIRREPWGKNMLLVALTGWGQERDRLEAYEAGFNFHLTKPADAAVLETLIAARRPPQDVTIAPG